MIEKIRCFQSVVRNNSFTEAAEECHISQSAVSQQIKALENEIGVPLIRRLNRRFELTPAGEHFYKKSVILIADYDRLVQETVRISKKDSAELRIGYLKSYGSLQIQNAVGRFSLRYPNVRVHITGGSHDDLYHMLRLEQIDLVLNDQRRAFSDEYINDILADKRTFAEIAARNPIAVLPSVTVGDLKNTPASSFPPKGSRRPKRTTTARSSASAASSCLPAAWRRRA